MLRNLLYLDLMLEMLQFDKSPDCGVPNSGVVNIGEVNVLLVNV